MSVAGRKTGRETRSKLKKLDGILISIIELINGCER